MLGKIFNKLIGRKSPAEESKIAAAFHEKTDQIHKFLSEKFEFAHQEYYVIKKKLENLRETNYNLGLHHLEKGHLTDAIFRFRIIKKFWPDLLDAQYQLAYCLMLNKKPQKARIVLQELVSNHPDYDPKARELLEQIENSRVNVS